MAENLPRCCIIGAGPSGFSTAKALKENGIPFDCFEMSDQIGGVWNFKNANGVSACYQSLHIDTSKFRMAFEDFPIPDEFPDYPHHAQIFQYFNDYLDHFGLRDMITFNTKVESARQEGEAKNGQWAITLSTGETRHYDRLIVANGHHWDQHAPDFPGHFDGPHFHSHKYVDPFEPVDMRGKRILVVGMGNSALDIASELSQKPIAEQLFIVARRGVWVFPKYIKGEVPDKGVKPAWMPDWLARIVMKKVILNAVGPMSGYGLPEPDHHPMDQHPSVSGEFLTRVGTGDVTVKPGIKELKGDAVVFEDGTEEKIDAIIYATGYNLTFPFFEDDTVQVVENHLPLFKRIFKPDTPGLYFMGLAQPLPTLVNFAEQQARWVVDHIKGDYVLPPRDEMERIIAADDEKATGHFYKSRRHTMQVNFDDYCRDIKKEWTQGRRRGLKRKEAA